MTDAKIALGVGLLGVSAVTILGASFLESQLVAILPLVALLIGGVALAVGSDDPRRGPRRSP